MGAGRSSNVGAIEVGHLLQTKTGLLSVDYQPEKKLISLIRIDQFVAHPSVQQLLASLWYDGLPGFRRKSMIGQLTQVAQLGSMFPVYSTIYMIAPNSEKGKFMKKPFVKFIIHSTSYATFLSLYHIL